MKINAINFYRNNTAFAAGTVASEKKDTKSSKVSTSTLAYGVAGLAAIGLATFGIIKGKGVKNAAPRLKKADINVEVKEFSMLGIGEEVPFVGVEKTFHFKTPEGNNRTVQRFYHNDKIYETNVYDDIETPDGMITNLTRYNFAYDKGKLVGVAKQTVDKDGNHWQVYKDGLWEPFPVMVKMKGEKEFVESGVFTPDALFEKDFHFDPYQWQ